jgi:hypothetical protein
MPPQLAPASGRFVYRPDLEQLEGRIVPSTYYWTGFDAQFGATSWSDAFNWVDSFGNFAVPAANSDLVFYVDESGPFFVFSHNNFNDLSGSGPGNSFPVNSTEFVGTLTNFDYYALQGNAVAVASFIEDATTLDPSAVDPTTGLPTVQDYIAFGIPSVGPQVIGVYLGGNVQFTGFFGGAGAAGSSVMTIVSTMDLNGHTLTLNGFSMFPLLDGQLTGSGNLVKNDPGWWSVNFNAPGALPNTFTGNVTINGGILLINNGTDLGSSNNGVTVNADTTLAITANVGQNNDIFSYSLTLNGTGAPGFSSSIGALSITVDPYNPSNGQPTIEGTIYVGSDSLIDIEPGSNFTSSTFNLAANIQTNGHNLTFAGPLTTVLRGTVIGGGMVFQGNTSFTGGALEGDGGKIESSVKTMVEQGTLEAGTPGNPNTLATGNTTFMAGTTMAVDISSSSNFSQLQVNGTLDISGSPTLNVSLDNNFTPGASDMFTIATASSITGTTLKDPSGNVLSNGSITTIGGQKFMVEIGTPASSSSSKGAAARNVIIALCPLPVPSVLPPVTPPANPVAGDSGTFMASVTSPCTVTAGSSVGKPGPGPKGPVIGGAVTFLFDGQPQGSQPADSNGTAKFTMVLSGGMHTYQVSFHDSSGVFQDSAWPGPGSPLPTLTVAQAPSITNLTSSVTSTPFGTSVSLTATVQAAGPNPFTPNGGQVNLLENGSVLATGTLTNGTVQLTTPTTLGIGTHLLTAQYVGDPNFSGSSSASVPLTVTKDATTTMLSPMSTLVVEGATVMYTVSVNGNSTLGSPTGQVQLAMDGVSLPTDTLNGGSLTFTTPRLAAGGHTFAATYQGDSNYTGSDGSASVTVNAIGPLGAGYYAVGAGPGGGPEVRVYHGTDQPIMDFFAYDPNFHGGVRVAVGDVNGDGTPDIITAPGPGGGPEIRVFDGKTGGVIRDFFAFSPTFTGGAYVAAGDIQGDHSADIIVGADAGGGPQVVVFDGQDGSVLRSFFAFDPNFHGGVRVAAGDVNDDGKADILVGAGPGGGPQVTVYNGADGAVLHSFFAFDPNFHGGVYLAAGDINGDGKADIIIGAAPGGGPHVTVFSGADLSLLDSFFAYDPNFSGGVTVAYGIDLSRPGFGNIATGPGPGGGPNVVIFRGDPLGKLSNFFAYDPNFPGGVYVGGA